MVTAMKLDSVMTSGAITSTDLDSSSNYSNEIEFSISYGIQETILLLERVEL